MLRFSYLLSIILFLSLFLLKLSAQDKAFEWQTDTLPGLPQNYAEKAIDSTLVEAGHDTTFGQDPDVKFHIDSYQWPNLDSVLICSAHWDDTESDKDQAYFFCEVEDSCQVKNEQPIHIFVKPLTPNPYNYASTWLGIIHNNDLYRAGGYKWHDEDVNTWMELEFSNFTNDNYEILPDTAYIDSLYFIVFDVYGDIQLEIADLHAGYGILISYTGNAKDSPVDLTDSDDAILKEFFLSQNYPNPFNPFTHISFHLPKTLEVKLEIYDSIGRFVSDLINEQMISGQHSVKFNARNFASGIYYYKLQAGEFIQVRKMLILK